jgi:drug/metabolite transporter superfamily protein YnfA
MTPNVFPFLFIAQAESVGGQHRFLWIPMTATLFWVVVAAVTAGVIGMVVAVVRARRRAARRSCDRS